MERVNIFNPFSNKPIEQEDPLTWAFLVTLKYNPLLQKFLCELVLREMVEAEPNPENWEVADYWKPANLSTQQEKIHIETAPNSIVSVLLTDVKIGKEIDVYWSNRDSPRYDGLIEYPKDLLLIIENKLQHVKTWEEQLSPNIESFPSDFNNEDFKGTLHERAVCLEWAEILEGVLGYIDSKFASFAGSEIASDFLTFVEENHPNLTPYRTFGLCAGRREALERRIDKLHRDVADKVQNRDRDHGNESNCKYEDSYIYREGQIAERIKFYRKNNQSLSVYLWPANTVTQVRQLHDYFEENGKAEFLNFEKDAQWKINRHLRFYYLNNVIDIGTYPDLSVDDYLRYFVDNNAIGQWRYETEEESRNLENFLCQLVEDNIISEQKLKEIKTKFFRGNINFMNIAPGFEIYQEWNLDEIVQLEQDSNLENQMIIELNRPLSIWGENL